MGAFWTLAVSAFLAMWTWSLHRLPLAVHQPLTSQAEPIGEIVGGQTVGQTFLAPYDGLYRVEVALADQVRPSTGAVTFRLSTEPGAPALVVVESLAREAIRDKVVLGFEFPPISDSAGRTYYFQLDAPGAVPGNALTAYAWPGAAYQPGAAYRAGRPVPGDLVFSIYFQVGLWERMRILLGQLTANKSFLWGDQRFYVGLIADYLALVAVLIREWVNVLRALGTTGRASNLGGGQTAASTDSDESLRSNRAPG